MWSMLLVEGVGRVTLRGEEYLTGESSEELSCFLVLDRPELEVRTHAATSVSSPLRHFPSLCLKVVFVIVRKGAHQVMMPSAS